jgi:hypothetical protein
MDKYALKGEYMRVYTKENPVFNLNSDSPTIYTRKAWGLC